MKKYDNKMSFMLSIILCIFLCSLKIVCFLSEIDNMDVIKDIIKKSGMKSVPAPKRLEKVKVNKDILRQ